MALPGLPATTPITPPLFDYAGNRMPPGEVPRKRPKGTDFYLQIPQLEVMAAWTTKKARTLALAHDIGMFYLSARLYYALLTDPRVVDGCEKRVLALRQLPFDVVPGKGAGAKKLAKKFARRLADIIPAKVASELYILGLIMGMGVAQPEWGYWYEDDFFYPRLRSWHPQLLHYLPYARQFDPINGAPGQLYTYVLGALGGLSPGTVPVITGSGQWVCFSMYGGDKPFLYGKIRAIWRPWIQRLLDQSGWIRFNDVHGLPIRGVHMPMGLRKTPDGRRFFAGVANLGQDATLYMPEPRDGDVSPPVKLELYEAKSRSFDTFRLSREDASHEIEVALTGGGSDSATYAKGDNYKRAGERADIRHEIKAADALAWAHCMNTQICIPFAQMNGFPAEAAPQISYDVRPPTSKLVDAQAATAVYEAILQAAKAQEELRKLGRYVPIEDLLESQGIILPATMQIIEEDPGPVTDAGQTGDRKPPPKSASAALLGQRLEEARRPREVWSFAAMGARPELAIRERGQLLGRQSPQLQQPFLIQAA